MRRLSFVVLVLAGLACGTFVSPLSAAPPEVPVGARAEAAPEKSPALTERLNTDEDYQLVQTLVDVIDEVERNYVKGIDRKELLQAAIRGVMSKLDPYSNYIPPDEMESFKQSLDAEFGGIGVQLGAERGQLKVISPVFGSPAYKAGVQAGDRLVEIEGQPTEGMSVEEASRLLRGKIGAEVRFKVIHIGEKQPVEVAVRREVIQLETVLGDRRKEDDGWDFFLDRSEGIGYIRMSAFSKDTTRLLKKAVRELKDEGAKGLILDLRFNPGGLLSAAVETCDLFLTEGPIVSTEDRDGKIVKFEAKKNGADFELPLVVLVNRFSASASEVVSACLQDHKRAVVIGERTWGKGSVQNLIEIPGGGALKLTTAAYYRPSGKNIHRGNEAKQSDEWGVTPDAGHVVQLSDDEVSQLLSVRRRRDIVGYGRNPGELDKIDSEFVDRQLQKALEALRPQIAARPDEKQPAKEDAASVKKDEPAAQ